jgi:ABC-type dipeptide/oligopeptide/nickel transport system permease subunit
MTGQSSMTSQTEPVTHEQAPAGLGRDAWLRLRRNRLAMLGLVIIALYVLAAIFGPWLMPYDFAQQDLAHVNSGPSLIHWLGTDNLGRDLFARTVGGARTALIVSFFVTVLSFSIGAIAGAVSGFVGGVADRTIMWLTDVTMTVPSLLLVVVINTSLTPLLSGWMEDLFLKTGNPMFRDTTFLDLSLVFGTIALIKWPQYARLMRAQVLSIRNANYVTAAIALGLPPTTIIRSFVVPNALGPVIVAVSFGLGTAMVLESSFSFLGIGVQPPTPSWGRMIADGMRVWGAYPHLLIVPALALAIITMAFALVGDGLNDALNPKGKK